MNWAARKYIIDDAFPQQTQQFCVKTIRHQEWLPPVLFHTYTLINDLHHQQDKNINSNANNSANTSANNTITNMLPLLMIVMVVAMVVIEWGQWYSLSVDMLRCTTSLLAIIAAI